MLVIPLLLFEIINGSMEYLLNATPGSIREAFSLPFQQTARYLCEYEDLEEEEKHAIEAVLGNVENLASRYDPNTADPVKVCFNPSATKKDLLNYFIVWGDVF